MIISLEGPQGEGKSNSAVALVYEDYLKTGRKVISNNHLNVPYQHFDLSFFIENLATHEMEDCIILLDEAYQYMDSRSTQTKMNKVWTYFVVQTRKRGVDLYICTHHLDHVDLRLRRAVDIRGACRFYPEIPCKKCKGTGQLNGHPCLACYGFGEKGVVLVNCLDKRRRRRFQIEIDAARYWSLYSTKERMPLQAKVLAGIETDEII